MGCRKSRGVGRNKEASGGVIWGFRWSWGIRRVVKGLGRGMRVVGSAGVRKDHKGFGLWMGSKLTGGLWKV